MNGLCGSAAVVALVLGLAAPAHAGKPGKVSKEDQAKQHASIALVKEGLVFYNLGRFDEAIERLERAYLAFPFPDVLFDLAQVHGIKKDFAKALGYYNAFLRDPGTLSITSPPKSSWWRWRRCSSSRKRRPSGRRPASP